MSSIARISERYPEPDDTDWADRCSYWLDQTPTELTKRATRKRWVRKPLILTGHGVRLRVEKGSLLVHDGFTHYPQKRQELRLFPGDWRLPSRIVILDSKGSISFDALSWLSENDIPLVQINWKGEVVNVAGGSGYAANKQLIEAQLAAQHDGSWIEIVRQLVSEKIANSIETLATALPTSPPTELAINKLQQDAVLMKKDPPSTVDGIRGVEGRVGFAYFSAWRSFPLRWKGIKRRPIPDDWTRIGQRQSYRSGTNRRATHPVNAMLNYAYGVLENQVRMDIVAAGLDPTIGYLHSRQPGRPALVFDLMEPLRPVMDREILKFVRNETFSPGDFSIKRNGVCRLNPQLARRIVVSANVTKEGLKKVFTCLDFPATQGEGH